MILTMEQSRRPIDLSFILHGPSSLTAPTFYQGVFAGTLLPLYSLPLSSSFNNSEFLSRRTRESTRLRGDPDGDRK